MGCGCGGSTSQWTPAEPDKQVTDDDGRVLSPNERIQQQVHQRQAARVWPAEWHGHQHTPA
jgi:hypothetical protein